MKLRKVKVGLIAKKTIAYRCMVLTTQIVFMWLLTHNITFSVSASILWNIINTMEYFGFEYTFSRIYKVGEDE